MKILVTGSDGQIGSELVKLLDKHDVLRIDRKSGHDLNTLETQDKIVDFAPDATIHLAASFERVLESKEFIHQNFVDNILATESMLSAIGGCKYILFASSYLVYDPSMYMDYSVPVHLYEKMSVRPRNLCGASKLYNERLIDTWCEHNGATASHARIFRVYSNQSKTFINLFAKLKQVSGVANVWNGNGMFDFIHARDVAMALYEMLDGKVSGVFNVGSGVARSVNDVVRLIGVQTRVGEDYPHTERSCAEIGKLTLATGWKPQITLEDGIREMMS